MFYSDSPWNWTDPTHQHFSLMEDPTSPSTYYIGFEDGIHTGTEGYGDFNDVIFKLQTTPNQTFNISDERSAHDGHSRTGDLLDPGTRTGGVGVDAAPRFRNRASLSGAVTD